ncbi:family 16 glycoside hydrolase [Desertivirga xinjiangensis]|uniref:family 16 glycoside hydrolase n=1 Tax=Desertivirga xinjiangensis TaxID=539206 RepID=UPI00210C7DD2|nr:family 16 glycoside hydrolase [Pedobacter xinjiangensis]
MTIIEKVLVAIFILTFFGKVQAQNKVELTIDASKVEKKIDKKLYGVLLEHLYHSVSNGLWGETVWNRSFEELMAIGDWSVDNNGKVRLAALGKQRGRFHIAKGKNYELSLEFRKTAGNGAVLLGLRDQYRDLMQTNSIYLHFGANNNSNHLLETSKGWIWHTPRAITTIEDKVKGNLSLNRWNRLRVRVSDKHLAVWLNQQKIFDKEIENPPLDGAVRLAGEDTDVEFRDIKILSLKDQKPLKTTLALARHWTLAGEARLSLINEDALNHNVAVNVVSEVKGGGMVQSDNYNVLINDLLRGSVFLKGEVKAIKVQLLNGADVIAEQVIAGIKKGWNEYPIVLKPEEDCASASFRILSEGEGNWYIDQISLMHQSSIDNDGFRRDIFEVNKSLQPTLVRWPGGSFVELYDFENGLGKQHERKGILRWDDFDPLSFGTDEFIKYCQKVGAEPQIVLPIGYHNYDGYAPDRNGKTDWLRKAQDWLEYCNGSINTPWGAKRAANGHPESYNVKYWEIDNEVWKMDPKLYAELVRLYSMTLKRQDPNVKIIACGSGRLGKEGVGLDSVIIHKVAEYVDYISPHHYMDLAKYGNDGVEAYGKYLDQLAKWIARSKNPEMKIYVSEWNLDKTDMRTGLFAGGFLNRLERTEGVEMAAPALLMRHTSAPGWDNAFINFDHSSYFLAPNYLVMELWRSHFAPNRIQVSGDPKELNVIATKSENGRELYFKVVNPGSHDYQLILNTTNLTYKDVRFKVVTSDSLTAGNDMKVRDRIKVKEESVPGLKNTIKLTVPKWSAGVIEMK